MLTALIVVVLLGAGASPSTGDDMARTLRVVDNPCSTRAPYRVGIVSHELPGQDNGSRPDETIRVLLEPVRLSKEVEGPGVGADEALVWGNLDCKWFSPPATARMNFATVHFLRRKGGQGVPLGLWQWTSPLHLMKETSWRITAMNEEDDVGEIVALIATIEDYVPMAPHGTRAVQVQQLVLSVFCSMGASRLHPQEHHAGRLHTNYTGR